MRNTVLFSLLILFAGLFPQYAQAVDNGDGFDQDRVINTRYFKVYLEDGVDMDKLAEMLTLPPSLRTVIEVPVTYVDSESLADQLDLFYLIVAQLLDMRAPEFTCSLKISRNSSQLRDIARRVFASEVPKTPGFYADQMNAIYLDAENINANVFGHELAHAIQNNYFLVRPPEKVQEILSGYIEYQFRKYTHTLPVK